MLVLRGRTVLNPIRTYGYRLLQFGFVSISYLYPSRLFVLSVLRKSRFAVEFYDLLTIYIRIKLGLVLHLGHDLDAESLPLGRGEV